MVRHARDKGWDSFCTGMHYLGGGDVVQMEPIPLLARLIPEAGEMAVGTAVLLLNLHNPVWVAETFATLDILARGNFFLGIGLGYRDVEFDAFGVPKGQRVRRFEQHLDVVKRLWSGEPVTFHNEACTLDNVTANLRPVQKPHPPIWVAANADAAVRRAARIGDNWFINPHGTFQTNRRQMGLYIEERKKTGLPLPTEIPCRKDIFCAKDRRTALAMVAPYLSERYQIYLRWGQDKAMPADDRIDLPFEELQKDRFAIGSPEECFEQLRPYWEQLGVTQFMFRTHFIGMPLAVALHSLRMISEELLPALRKVEPRPLAEIAGG
jgi:alkanesulfonate monooxygenase SsuD/methylene tetrahydromethanopterin reductase-like flavin-dependent oxidoreductase (luciferase family)